MTFKQTLSPEDRVRSSLDFQKAHRQGKPTFSNHMVVNLFPSEGTRLGIIVTKGTGKAVVRNQWKRMIRETFRLHRDLLSLGCDHVVRVKRDTKGKPTKQDRQELIQLFQRAKNRHEKISF